MSTAGRTGTALGLSSALLVLSVALGGCGPVETPSDAARPAPPPAALDAAGLAAADLERGAVLSLACQACHGFREGQDLPLGPSLAGVFGRPAGTVAGFAYSDALRGAGLVWTPEALDAWLADPAGYLPGNNMAFAGYAQPTDRRDLIAYLLSATAVESSSRP